MQRDAPRKNNDLYMQPTEYSYSMQWKSILEIIIFVEQIHINW